MADYSYSSSKYPQVRAVIGLDVDTVSLPDGTLSLDVYHGEAERFVMRSLTETQWSSPTVTAWVDYAATLYLASLVVPSLRLVQSERLPGGNLTYAPVDLTKLASVLRSRAMERISDIEKAVPVGTQLPVNPNVFTVAHRRWSPSQYPVPEGLSGTPDTYPLYIFGETPTGAMNGVNTVFSTAFNFRSTTLKLYLNGILDDGTGFSVVGNNTFTVDVAPASDDYLRVDYERA